MRVLVVLAQHIAYWRIDAHGVRTVLQTDAELAAKIDDLVLKEHRGFYEQRPRNGSEMGVYRAIAAAPSGGECRVSRYVFQGVPSQFA